MRGLYVLKPWYARRLALGVSWAVRKGVSPDVFTALGVVAAVGAAAAIAVGWWPLAALALAGRLAGANLDGAVARARAVSRPWGFVLNELGDRASDLLAFAGLAVFAWRDGGLGSSVVWVLAAALAATLPTFVSLAAAGAGGTRLNGGPFGKTERCLALVVACALPAALTWVCVVVVAGSVVTAVLRAVSASRELSAPAGPGDRASADAARADHAP